MDKCTTIINKFYKYPNQQHRSVYICDHCHKVIVFTHNQIRDIVVEADADHFELDSIDMDFTVRCTKCDDFMFKCDPNLAERIIKLNELNLPTLYCCEGHIDEVMYPFHSDNESSQQNLKYIVRMPYIAFSADLDLDVEKYIKEMISSPEYSFISFEEADSHYDFNIIRGSLYGEPALEIRHPYSDDESSTLKHDFIMMRTKFLDFVDLLIAHYTEEGK